MANLSVALPRPRLKPRLALGIALLGLMVVLSPYFWLEAWDGVGFATAYVPFHLWTWVPFLVLAAAAGRLGAVTGAFAMGGLIIGTLVAVELASGGGTDDQTLGLALPGLLALATIGIWAVRVRKALVTVAVLIAAAVVGGRVAGLGDVARLQTFLVIGTSIIIEALPFVVLGAAVSSAIEVFVPARWFERIARLPLPLQVPAVALTALALPVCECGSVPVARRLIIRGVHPAAGIAFMLAAPVINPIVLLSTAVAYQGRGALEMVAGRAGLGMAVALIAGAVIALSGTDKIVAHARSHDPASDHGHDHGSGGRPRMFTDHLVADLILMGKFIVLGSAIAAAMQTLVPQSVFTGVLTTPLIGALLMIVLAFFLSLCSEADAFVAVSFIQFPLGPQLAFLVAGPVLDTKLVLLYGSAFGRWFVVKLALVVVPVVVAGSLLFQAVVT